MKNFRSRVIQSPPTLADIEALLKGGQFAKALRKARATGLVIPQHTIDAAAVEMFRSGRAGELVSLMGTPSQHLLFETRTLLRRIFEAHDHHTFLKQVHRLRLSKSFEKEIRHSIAEIEARAPGSSRMAPEVLLGATTIDVREPFPLKRTAKAACAALTETSEWAAVEAGFIPADPARLRAMAAALELRFDQMAAMALLCRGAGKADLA